VNAIVSAALANNQVRWIVTDEDLLTFYRQLADTHGDVIEPESMDELLRLLNPVMPEPDDEDIPF
jgi:hypothetical protein